MAFKLGKSLVSIMALGTFVVVIDNTIMNVSISALVEDLNTTVSGVQAAISLNALMMAAFVLMGGKLADILGMKKTFITGAIIYVIGSLLASMSNNLLVFILGWCAIQGFGAALMLPNVNTIIRANVMGPARAQAYGLMAGINALGMAVGPLLGGFLTTYFSWRWAFRIEVFVLLFVLLMRNVIPKDKLTGPRPALDKLGVFWQALAMIFLVVATLAISDYGLLIAKQPFVIFGYEFAPFGLSIVPFLFGIGILCLMMFVKVENNLTLAGKESLIKMSLFKIVDFVKGLNIRFIQVALVAGTTFVVPLYLQVTFGLSAFETGFILIGFTAGLLASSIGASKKGLNVLPKKKIELGFLISILGILVMIFSIYLGVKPISLVPGIFIYGLGLGLITSQIVNLVMASVKAEDTAEASGVTSTLETLGSSVGTAIIGSILVVSLTTGITMMVNDSQVLPPEVKAEITNNMQASVEVVSTEVLSDAIPEGSIYEEEVIRIYDEARQNAFAITLLFMAFTSLVSFVFAKGLPAVQAKEAVE